MPDAPVPPPEPSATVAPPATAMAFTPDYSHQPKGLSVLSLVIGILGLLLSLVVVGGVLSLVAVVLGHISAVRQPHAKGLWLTGLITGYLGIVISIIVVIVVAVLGSFATWFVQIL
jgi:hypothetical protein